MARVLFSDTIVNASGKTGGVYYSKGTGCHHCRPKPKQKQIPTVYQLARRNYIGSLSARWRSLTASQRKQWQLFANSGRFMSRVGEKPISKGFQLYLSQNYWRYFNSLTLLSTPLPVGARRTINALFTVVSTTIARYDTWCSFLEGAVSGSGEVRVSRGVRKTRKLKNVPVCSMRFNSWTAAAQNLWTTQFRARYGNLAPVGATIKIELYIYDTNLVQVTDYRRFFQTVT